MRARCAAGGCCPGDPTVLPGAGVPAVAPVPEGPAGGADVAAGCSTEAPVCCSGVCITLTEAAARSCLAGATCGGPQPQVTGSSGGGASGSATCTARERRCLCTRELRPVCGEDGADYNNPCLACCAGTEAAYEGPCTRSGAGNGDADGLHGGDYGGYADGTGYGAAGDSSADGSYGGYGSSTSSGPDGSYGGDVRDQTAAAPRPPAAASPDGCVCTALFDPVCGEDGQVCNCAPMERRVVPRRGPHQVALCRCRPGGPATAVLSVASCHAMVQDRPASECADTEDML